MWRQVLALSALTAVNAATGNVTVLCQLLKSTCTSHLQAAMTPAQCETLFSTAVVTSGTDADTGINTIGCRQNYAMKAAANMTTMGYNCYFAGFTGGGLCGTVLDNACNANIAICTQTAGMTAALPYSTLAQCQTNLASQAAIWGSLQGSVSAGEDSLECRVYHATAAFTGAGDQHCGHTGSPGNATFCGGPVSTSAAHHCGSTMGNCKASNTPPRNQYADMGTCMASFMTFPDSNVNASDVGNNRGCRQYHGNAALVLADTSHCAHSGPSGGGVCGTPRDSWRIMAGTSSCLVSMYAYVNVSVALAFASWNSSDLLAIVPAGTAGLYSAATNTASDDDLCRIYHLSVATTTPNPHCDHGTVLGLPCGAVATTACRYISAACGTDMATCGTYVGALLAANKTGLPSLTPSNTDTLSCRLYYAGVALASKMMGTAGMAGVTSNCKSVASASTLCVGGGMAPTNGATVGAVSVFALFAGLFAL